MKKRDRAVAALEAVIDETRLLFHRLKAVAEQVHRQGELTAGRRGVLRDLDREGPQTVPAMARARPVSRQHIQTLVNALLEDGHVELIDNPAHKRSKLVRLTPRGKRLVERMAKVEAELLGGLEPQVSNDELHRAAETLRAVRRSFESPKWNRRVSRSERR